MRTNLGWKECAMKGNELAYMETKKSYFMLYFPYKY
jgi:hypothetical protein